MNTRNYQKELDAVIADIEKTGNAPKLLLHSCCAPCSSYVLEYLSKYFSVTDFYYNPNITEREEYRKRVGDQIFTDTLGAHNAGVAPLLVKPIRLAGNPGRYIRYAGETPFRLLGAGRTFV